MAQQLKKTKQTYEMKEVPWKKEPFEFKGKIYEVGFNSPSVRINGESGTFKILSWETSTVNGKLIINCWWEGYYLRSVYAERLKTSKTSKRTKIAGHIKFCNDHPQYGGIRKPRTDCKSCWDAYNSKHPPEEIKVKQKRQTKAQKPTKIAGFVMEKVSNE